MHLEFCALDVLAQGQNLPSHKITSFIFAPKKTHLIVLLEDYKDVFHDPCMVFLACQVCYTIDLAPNSPLFNKPLSHKSFLENNEIQCHIQELILQDVVQPNYLPCFIQIVPVSKKVHGTSPSTIDHSTNL